MSGERDREGVRDELELELLQSAALLDVPSELGKERVRALATGAAAVGVGAAAAALAPKTAALVVKKWVVITLLGAGALAGFTYVVYRGLRHPPVSSAGASSGVAGASAPVEPVAPSTSATGEAPRDTPAAQVGDAPLPPDRPGLARRPTADVPPSAARSPAASASPAGSRLAEQIAALDHARDLVQQGRPGEASRELDDFDRRFPKSALAQEAAVTRIQALLGAGRRSEAAEAARRFLASHPDSSHAARVRELLRSGSTDDP